MCIASPILSGKKRIAEIFYINKNITYSNFVRILCKEVVSDSGAPAAACKMKNRRSCLCLSERDKQLALGVCSLLKVTFLLDLL